MRRAARPATGPGTEPSGVVFPRSGASRSTSALGRAVVADALAPVDAIGARAALAETNWRRGYGVHFRRLVEAGLSGRDDAVAIARAGLASLHARMRHVRDGHEDELASAFTIDERTPPLATVTVRGAGAVRREFTLPYRGQWLGGAHLHRQLDAWVAAGTIEPSCAGAVRLVADNPDWLDLSDRRVVILGAGAEMGPLTALLHWGADVVAVDLPRPAVWQRVLRIAQRCGGTLRVPVARPASGPPAASPAAAPDHDDLARRAGADLLHDLGRVAAWLSTVDGPMVLGNYVYADGATHVRVAVAVDALTERLRSRRADTALAFLATPTDVFAVPREAVSEAADRYAAAAGIGRIRRPLRILSAGRLLARNYPPDADPGIVDSLVPQQGPNYALAKRLQRWRATVARADGVAVSLTVAPATRTRSVLRNRLLAAAYAGAHRFGVEVFEPATSNTLMAALLVHDLRVGSVAREHPWQDEAFAAAHGGLWRQPYAPRSVLGIAVLLGVGAARG